MSIAYYLPDNKEFNKPSRYQTLRVVVDDEEQTYLETYNQIRIPESDDDAYHVVTHAEVNRLDIISNIYYQTPDYYWAIALANNMIDPFVVNEGVLLRVPSILTLTDFQYKILER